MADSSRLGSSSLQRRREPGEYVGIRQVREGEYSAEFCMAPHVDIDELQSVFSDYETNGASGLSYSVHRVRDFQRPASMQFLKTSACEWPWDSLLLPWHTSEGRMKPSFPKSVEDLWDPAHARDMEAAGRIMPRINWGNAYENGQIVENSSRHIEIVSDVVCPTDDFLSIALAEDGESAVLGIFLVHEHTTNVWFPVTDNSVIQWCMSVKPIFCETAVTVTGRASSSGERWCAA